MHVLWWLYISDMLRQTELQSLSSDSRDAMVQHISVFVTPLSLWLTAIQDVDDDGIAATGQVVCSPIPEVN